MYEEKGKLFLGKRNGFPIWMKLLGAMIVLSIMAVCVVTAMRMVDANRPGIINKYYMIIFPPGATQMDYSSARQSAGPYRIPKNPQYVAKLTERIKAGNLGVDSTMLKPGDEVYVPDGYLPAYVRVREGNLGGFTAIAEDRWEYKWLVDNGYVKYPPDSIEY